MTCLTHKNTNKAKAWTLLKFIFTKIYRLQELARVDLDDACFENNRYPEIEAFYKGENKTNVITLLVFFFLYKPRRWYKLTLNLKHITNFSFQCERSKITCFFCLLQQSKTKSHAFYKNLKRKIASVASLRKTLGLQILLYHVFHAAKEEFLLWQNSMFIHRKSWYIDAKLSANQFRQISKATLFLNRLNVPPVFEIMQAISVFWKVFLTTGISF